MVSVSPEEAALSSDSPTIHDFQISYDFKYIFENHQCVVSQIKTILKQLLGHVPGEDFDQYTDSHAVATRHQKSTPKISVDDKQSVNTEA